MKDLTFKAVLGAFAVVGLAAPVSPAVAMPALNRAMVAQTQGSNIEQTRWVCGPYRCWWRPGYGYYGRPHYWGGGYYGRPHYWGGYRPHYWGGYRRHYWGGYGHHWRHW